MLALWLAVVKRFIKALITCYATSSELLAKTEMEMLAGNAHAGHKSKLSAACGGWPNEPQQAFTIIYFSVRMQAISV